MINNTLKHFSQKPNIKNLEYLEFKNLESIQLMFLECTKKERMFQKTSKDTTEYKIKHLNSSLNSLHVKEKNIRDMQKCKTNRSTLV